MFKCNDCNKPMKHKRSIQRHKTESCIHRLSRRRQIKLEPQDPKPKDSKESDFWYLKNKSSKPEEQFSFHPVRTENSTNNTEDRSKKTNQTSTVSDEDEDDEIIFL
ncbi:unnamed protein product [Ceutorhynchus assimilis]|uniref:C2H2-type domain-containing protein n=1 Tax=Ceutorhynchus assimilis TaxID=467358 RepID=A0A9N9MTK1_9CUCU|nr:unnamed protein product [Ceutorhynchus assimilis]